MELLKFESVITCKVCNTPSVFSGCEKHAKDYPAILNGKVVVPLCDKCEIHCDACREHYVTSDTSVSKSKIKVEKSINTKLLESLFEGEEVVHFKRATKGILDIIFALDIGSQMGLEEVVKDIPDIPISKNMMKRETSKLSELLFTKLMINAAGLSMYEKEIMENKIGAMYGRRNDREQT